ncbi:glycosyltransferase family 4 protein [Pontibacter virosus]|uniref:Glycosyltransferase involved in cell wall biosynthesis n=1 Tax=Pontibacter virosus TaxID=1765052 RepID=A0A2U1AQJ5_9BACT|nr:glycosyltransferase family 4 protein [Pontibacter virosus]PVY38676.1 glycosyltransferase involved in cell wall biosynthesis [Pontibacter virosus]
MLKVLLYSHFFYPSIGGIETVSLTLAKAFVENGLECFVVTKSDNNVADNFSFPVVRNPNIRQQLELVQWADVILCNGASLALQPWPLVLRKPVIWVHTGYQVSCIDGCGWVEGERAPLVPLDSVAYHLKRAGWRAGMIGAAKLFVRRVFAKHIVSMNVAITKWMLQAQPLPKQVHIYNPFPLANFKDLYSSVPEYDFIYLGRIVSEKGVGTLLRAFATVIWSFNSPSSLLIIGDGNWRSKMEQLAYDLQIAPYVDFVGKKQGRELTEYVSSGRIAIVPSEWYEPMGGVALELMAAGKNLIVSELGGLKEMIGSSDFTFPNGDYEALAKRMLQMLLDENLRNNQLRLLQENLVNFTPSLFIKKYIELLQEVRNKSVISRHNNKNKYKV